MKRRVEVMRGNSSDLFFTVLSNLRNLTTYNIAVSAVTNSNKHRGGAASFSQDLFTSLYPCLIYLSSLSP